MSKLSSKTKTELQRILRVGKAFNVDVFIIDKAGMRARADEAYIYLYKMEDFDFLECDSICIAKVADLNNRIEFMKGIDAKFDIELVDTRELDGGDVMATKLGIRSSSTYIEVGCAAASSYKLPRSIADTNIVSFELDKTNMDVLNGLPRIMRNKNNIINIKAVSGVIIGCGTDTGGDTATHILTKSPKFNAGKVDFSFEYAAKNISPVLRLGQDQTFAITERGILVTEVDGITVVVLPEKS